MPATQTAATTPEFSDDELFGTDPFEIFNFNQDTVAKPLPERTRPTRSKVALRKGADLGNV